LGTKVYPISYNNETYSDSLAFALKEAIKHKQENYPNEWAVVSLSVSDLYGDSRLFNSYVNEALLNKLLVVRSQGTIIEKLILSEEGLRNPMALFAIKVGHHKVLSDGKVIPLAPQGADFSLPDLLEYVYPDSSGGYSETAPGEGGSSVNTALVAGLVEVMLNDNPSFNQVDGLNGWMLVKDALARASTQIAQDDLVIPEQTYRLSLYGEVNFEEAINEFKDKINNLFPPPPYLNTTSNAFIQSTVCGNYQFNDSFSAITVTQFKYWVEYYGCSGTLKIRNDSPYPEHQGIVYEILQNGSPYWVGIWYFPSNINPAEVTIDDFIDAP
jgi:hypothetical protein